MKDKILSTKQEDRHTHKGEAVNPIVAFQDLTKENYNADDDAWGNVRLYKVTGGFNLQFRAKQTLTRGSKSVRHMIASASLSIEELRGLLTYAEEALTEYDVKA